MMRDNSAVIVGVSLVVAALVHSCTSTMPTVVALSERTYLAQYVNATYHCTIDAVPACRRIVETLDAK